MPVFIDTLTEFTLSNGGLILATADGNEENDGKPNSQYRRPRG
mgnify:FL=1